MRKSDIRLINAVYRESHLGLPRYPLSQTHALFGQKDAIEALLASGDLCVQDRSLTPSLSVAILAVPDTNQHCVSERTRLYVTKNRKERQAARQRNERRSHIDFYKRERNPWMGFRLKRNGGKTICTQCRAINKPCEHGEEFLFSLPVEARPPKANASETRWKAFEARFLKQPSLCKG